VGWARPKPIGLVAQVHSASYEFPLGLSGINQIEFKSLEICHNSNKFDKCMNPTLKFELKNIIYNKNIK
jgi:hypothetical protein